MQSEMEQNRTKWNKIELYRKRDQSRLSRFAGSEHGNVPVGCAKSADTVGIGEGGRWDGMKIVIAGR